MKNTFGQSMTMTLFGESHGECVGVVIDGLAPGIFIDKAKIEAALSLRRPSALDTTRIEKDEFSIVSGIFNEYTTGTPLTILIYNKDIDSNNYIDMRGLARPSHADYTAFMKYHGFEDYRGGGHFSGRLTAAIVAAGAIFSSPLSKSHIKIASHILRLGGISDKPFSLDPSDEIATLIDNPFPVLDDKVQQKMCTEIQRISAQGDSLGGIIETAVCGVPAGLGEPWFDNFESILSHALFSIGGIKGISFGKGFALSDMKGSEANDSFYMTNNKTIKTKTNRNGGINGGISNGMPIVFSCAVKPTPSIYLKQETINFLSDTNASLSIKGRHDPAFVRRLPPVINALTAFVICDFLCVHFGTDILANGLNHNQTTL